MIDNSLISSVIGTLIAEIITLPICTIKTVYQNNKSFTFSSTVRYIYEMNGMRGFLSASIPAVISQIVSTSSKYTIYEKLKDIRHTETSNIYSNSINGAISGILGSILTHPVDVWKNFNQRGQLYYRHLKSFTSVKEILTKGLYVGYVGSLSKNIVLYSMLFPLNDFYKSKFDSIYISAPLTTLTVSMVIQPFDYYKVVKMAGNRPSHPFRGFNLMIARSIPHFMITMIVTDYLKK